MPGSVQGTKDSTVWLMVIGDGDDGDSDEMICSKSEVSSRVEVSTILNR